MLVVAVPIASVVEPVFLFRIRVRALTEPSGTNKMTFNLERDLNLPETIASQQHFVWVQWRRIVRQYHKKQSFSFFKFRFKVVVV